MSDITLVVMMVIVVIADLAALAWYAKR